MWTDATQHQEWGVRKEWLIATATLFVFDSTMALASSSFQNCLTIRTFFAENRDLRHFLAISRKFSDNFIKKILKVAQFTY